LPSRAQPGIPIWQLVSIFVEERRRKSLPVSVTIVAELGSGDPAALRLTACEFAVVTTLASKSAVTLSNRKAESGREHVACLGAPVQVKEISPRKPFRDATSMGNLPVPPAGTVMDDVVAITEKSGLAPGGVCKSTETE